MRDLPLVSVSIMSCSLEPSAPRACVQSYTTANGTALSDLCSTPVPAAAPRSRLQLLEIELKDKKKIVAGLRRARS